jgi:hypothetical protein
MYSKHTFEQKQQMELEFSCYISYLLIHLLPLQFFYLVFCHYVTSVGIWAVFCCSQL